VISSKLQCVFYAAFTLLTEGVYTNPTPTHLLYLTVKFYHIVSVPSCKSKCRIWYVSTVHTIYLIGENVHILIF